MKEANPQYIQRLRDLRIRLRLTQSEFAIAAGITRGCLAAWEEGRGAPWNRKALDHLAASFGCDHPSDIENLRLIATSDGKILKLHEANKERGRKWLMYREAQEKAAMKKLDI